MPSAADLYRRTVPEPVRRVLTGAARRAGWELGLLRLRTLSPGTVPSDRVLRVLHFGWGNPLYSSSTAYLREVVERCASGHGAIVEAGSGLTTVLIGHVAPADRRIVAYEHLSGWASRVDRGFRGRPSPVRRAELRDYGEFEWYDVDPPAPSDIALLVCDGPPGSCKGGRYGALGLLHDRLTADAIVLLDDAGRDGERDVLRRWEADFGASVELRGSGPGTYAIVHPAR